MPFKASTIPLLRTSVLKGEFEISQSLSSPCCRLIQRILVNSPTRRPTIDQLLKCQWFEYVQSPAIKKTISKDSNTNSQESDISEVPNRRNKIFWLFSTSGQYRQYPPRSSKNRNIVAANEIETTIETIRTIKCSTKRANSVLDENFLYPLKVEETAANPIKDSDTNLAKETSDINGDSQKGRKFSLSRIVRKRVSPIEISNTKNNDKTNSNSKGQDFRITLENLIVEGHGRHVMYPTLNGHIHSLESETRKHLEKLGIWPKMLEKAIENGPRSDIMGIYRIIIHRLQKEQAIDDISSNEHQIDSRHANYFNTQTKKQQPRNQNPKVRYTNSVNCAIL